MSGEYWRGSPGPRRGFSLCGNLHAIYIDILYRFQYLQYMSKSLNINPIDPALMARLKAQAALSNISLRELVIAILTKHA